MREAAIPKIVALVFVGGGVGALVRELLMLQVPAGPDGFPVDIFVANIVGSFVLGVVAAVQARRRIGDGTNALFGIGFCGGLTTFSSFVYASVVLAEKSPQGIVVVSCYVLLSVLVGYLALRIGQRIGGA